MYSTSQITDESYPEIRDLYLKCFNVRESLENIQKKYDTSHFKLKNQGFFARLENNEAVAYYGVFPIILKNGTNDLLVAQSGDTMTSPLHQKKGLFVTLANKTYTEAGKNGIQLIFGFPNTNSYPGFKNKLNWIFIGNLQKFTLRNRTLPLNELSSKFKFLKSFYKIFIRLRFKKFIITPDHHEAEKLETGSLLPHIKHDLNFLKYKLQNDTVQIIRIDKFVLLVKLKGHLFVGEAAPFEKSETPAFLNAVKKIGRMSGSKKTIFQMSKNNWLYPYLQPYLTVEESLPIGYYKFNDSIDLEKISFSLADLDTF